MGKKVERLLTFLTCAHPCTLCACAAEIEEEEEAEVVSLRGTSERPRLFLLRLFIIPHRGQINQCASSRYNSPSRLDSLLYLFFVLSLFVHICIALDGKQF